MTSKRPSRAEKIVAAIKNLEQYLAYVSTWDDARKHNNPRAWRDALEAAAWLSVYKHGKAEYVKIAERVIVDIFG